MNASGCKYSFLEAKAKLEALCAYQERCSFELEKKMIQWKMPADDRNALLAHLIEFNFLSEERFAEAYVSGKINIKKWGRIKIRQQLKLKHISEYSIKRAIDAVDNDVYWKNLKGLAEKKYASLSTQKDSYDKKVKVYRFLSSKGYETDLLRDASDELFNT